MLKLSALFFSSLILISPLLAAAAVRCEQIFLPGVRAEARKSLAQDLDFRELNFSSQVERLSKQGVFLIQPGLGREPVVLRLSGHTANIRFELFAAQVAQRVGLLVPQVERLSQSKTLEFLEILKSKKRGFYQDLVDRQLERDLPLEKMQASLASFRPGVRGQQFLESRQFNERILRLLTYAAEPYAIELRARFLADWNVMPPHQMEAARVMFRPVAGERDAKGLFEFLFDQSPKLDARSRENLIEISLSQIPREILGQIADAWAVYNVLGIPDFHSGNWMVHQNRVWSIDMAYTKEHHLTYGALSPLQIPSRQSPFGFGDMSPELERALMKMVSPRMRLNLKQLSLEQLQAWARETGYPLSHEFARMILLRAGVFYQGVEN